MVKIEKILFTTELRDYSLKILPYVTSMSEKYNSIIYLLHVIEDLSTSLSSRQLGRYSDVTNPQIEWSFLIGHLPGERHVIEYP